jgi:hypothetical protein
VVLALAWEDGADACKTGAGFITVCFGFLTWCGCLVNSRVVDCMEASSLFGACMYDSIGLCDGCWCVLWQMVVSEFPCTFLSLLYRSLRDDMATLDRDAVLQARISSLALEKGANLHTPSTRLPNLCPSLPAAIIIVTRPSRVLDEAEALRQAKRTLLHYLDTWMYPFAYLVTGIYHHAYDQVA